MSNRCPHCAIEMRGDLPHRPWCPFASIQPDRRPAPVLSPFVRRALARELPGKVVSR